MLKFLIWSLLQTLKCIISNIIFYFFSPLTLQKIEPWEAEKTVADREEYIWDDSPSQKNILDVLQRMKGDSQEQLLGTQEVQQYKNSVTRLKNEGESEDTMLQYKEAVKKVLSL